MSPAATVKTDQPAVSVVIPLYNKARHVSRALESVLRQTFTDYEVIVVDDGSTDNGAELVVGCPDRRVRLVTQTNMGASAARNRGVAEAQSKLVAFLDADDEWLEGFLSRVCDLSKEYPNAALWGTACWLERGDGRRVHFPKSQLHNGTGAYTGEIDYFAEPSFPFNTSSILVKKQALLDAGMFPLNLHIGEDVDTFIRIALRFPVVRTREPRAVEHWDADNRSNAGHPYFTGVPPYCDSVDRYYRQEGNEARVPGRIVRFLYTINKPYIVRNWLCGDYSSARALVAWFARRRGYRLRCGCWRILLLVPWSAVLLGRKVLRVLRGQSLELAPCRSVYRQ